MNNILITPLKHIVAHPTSTFKRMDTKTTRQEMPRDFGLVVPNRADLDLVDAGIGLAFIPNECVEPRPGIQYVPLENWHQALYMCIRYGKWQKPPMQDFVELIVKTFRKSTGRMSMDFPMVTFHWFQHRIRGTRTCLHLSFLQQKR